MRRTVLACIAMLLATLPLQVVSPQAQASTGLEWWGPEEVGQGFHIRVPVTVHNDLDHEIRNGLVMAHVDTTTALVEAGWVHEVSGLQERLQSFELDPASVRVVEMTDLDPASPGTTHGRLRVHDASLSTDDRYEVPSTHFEGFVEGPAGAAFDARRNPILTVLWRVDDLLEPGDARTYMVYLDSRTNTRHTPSDHASTIGWDILEGTFWSGPGTDLVGFARPEGTSPGTVQVLGLHPDTQVRVLVATEGGTFVPHIPKSGDSNPFVVGQDETHRVILGNEPTTFRLMADRPVLALVTSEGFVPARDGGFVGKEFLFATTYPVQDMQDSLYLLNRHPAAGTGTGAETRVELQRLDAEGMPVGAAQTITLSDSQDNPFPYTLGEQSPRPDGSCTFPDFPWNPPFGPAPATYRARVVQGGPVAIQHDVIRGITPVPALDEGPAGTEFWSVLSRSNWFQADGSCPNRVVKAYEIFAAAPAETGLEVFSPETKGRVSPEGSGPGHAIGPTGAPGSDGSLTVDTPQLNDRPLRLRTGEPAWMMVGRTGDAQSLRDVAFRGPLGGSDAGRGFAGVGDAVVYAPYANTRIEVDVQGLPDPLVTHLAQERAMPLADALDTEVEGRWYTLRADRPLLVLPTGASTGFLPAVPAMLSAAVHVKDAEYRGYLVDIASPSGLDPVTASTVPGEPVQYTLQVTNRGKGVHGADLRDAIQVCPEQVPPGWSADVQGSEGCERPTVLNLASGETRTVTLMVTPPGDAAAGELGILSVRATSGNNRAVSDTVETVTHIKSSFEVGMWFDFPQVGPTVRPETVHSANETAHYKVVVQNLGSVVDTITLTLTPPEGGWGALLAGQEAVQLTLPPVSADPQGSIATLELSVTPPEGLTEGTLFTTITAQGSVPSVLDRVTAITSLEAPSEILLDVDESVAWVGPGAEAAFNVTLRNNGDGTAQVFMDLQHDGLPGWTAPQVVLLDPNTGERIPLDQISLAPGDVVPLQVVVTAAANATAGERNALRFHVATDTVGEDQEAFLHAIVEPEHRLVAQVASLPVRMDQGAAAVPVDLRLRNDGNLDERLVVGIAAAPPGWNVSVPAQVFVARNATQSLDVRLAAPDGVATGTYQIVLRAVSSDGNVTRIPLPVEVDAFAHYTVDVPGRVPAQPGRTVPVAVDLVNTGNTAVTFHAEPVPEAPWALDAASLRLEPGASSTLEVGWRVPADAKDGVSTHRLDLVAVSDDTTVGELRQTVAMELDVGRPDLGLSEATGFEGAAGRFIQAVVHNDGTRTAHDVEIWLQVGTEVVDRLTIANLPPGATHNATFLQPQGSPGRAVLIIDGAAAVVEVDETDNTLAVAAGHVEAPLPPTLLLAAALGAAFLRRRMR